MALTPEEEKRKETYPPREQAIARAMAEVFHNGNEDIVWRGIFEIADEELHDPRYAPRAKIARIHLKATD